jgi:ATP-dependent Lon protease
MGYRESLAELPIFPLPRVTLFPGTVLPLHVFEPRYRALVADCMKGERAFALVTLADAASTNTPDAPPPFHPIACVGEITELQHMPDGRANLLLEGRARVRLEELPFRAPYRRCVAQELDSVESQVASADILALRALAQQFVELARPKHPKFDLVVPVTETASTTADFVAAHLLLRVEERLRALELLDVAERVKFVLSALAAQVALATAPRAPSAYN